MGWDDSEQREHAIDAHRGRVVQEAGRYTEGLHPRDRRGQYRVVAGVGGVFHVEDRTGRRIGGRGSAYTTEARAQVTADRMNNPNAGKKAGAPRNPDGSRKFAAPVHADVQAREAFAKIDAKRAASAKGRAALHPDDPGRRTTYDDERSMYEMPIAARPDLLKPSFEVLHARHGVSGTIMHVGDRTEGGHRKVVVRWREKSAGGKTLPSEVSTEHLKVVSHALTAEQRKDLPSLYEVGVRDPAPPPHGAARRSRAQAMQTFRSRRH